MATKHMVRIKLADCVFDQLVYPRCTVDGEYVTRLVEALRAGAQFPPIVLELASNRIVDGVHRWHAYGLFYAPDHEIEAQQRAYASPAALFAEAMLRNSRHGIALSAEDRTRCIAHGRRMGIGDEVLAHCLQVTRDKLGPLRREPLDVEAPVTRNGSRSARLSGRTLTAEHVAPVKRAARTSLLPSVNRIIEALEAQSWERGNEALCERLRHLGQLIAEQFKEETNAA